MKKFRFPLILFLLSNSFYIVYGQEPEIKVEVKEGYEIEKSSELPVKKEKEAAKTQTTFKKEQLETSAGAGGINIFKAIELSPSLFVGTDDAYGLGGGTVTIRGFTNDQIGIEIDNMPLNDSGGYAIYPHEYIDVENLESATVERGATNKTSPYYADIGGSIKLRTKPPKNKFGVFYDLRYGSFGFNKEFFRIDTGLLKRLNLKAFISFSHTDANKWKGPGKYPHYRDHITIGLAQNFDRFRWEFYFDNNSQLNYFYRGLNYSQALDLDTYRRFDYNPTLIYPGGNGTAHNNATIRDNNLNYYGFYKNPYTNREYRANIEIDLSKNMMLSIKPYYWWGRGSGTSAGTFSSGGNTYISYRESYNYTDRPGLITNLSINLPMKSKIDIGYWWEYADLKQAQPSFPVKVNPDGSYTLLTNTTGTPSFRYNYIEKTKTYTNTPYTNITVKNLINMVDITAGFKYAQIKREFDYYNTTGVPYIDMQNLFDYPLIKNNNLSYSKTYRKFLPSLNIGLKIDENVYPYFAYARNFRVPKNYLGSFPAGVTAEQVANALSPELSDTFDLGVRFDYGTVYIVPAVYYTKYKNRIIYFTDPTNPSISYPQNVGKVDAYGAEIEVGMRPLRNLSLYTSASYNIAKLKEPKYCGLSSPGTCLNIDGNQVPNTPKFMYKLGLNYEDFGVSIKPTFQYFSSRYGDLTNKEQIGGYSIVNLNISTDRVRIFNKKVTAYVDIQNLLDTKYISRISVGDTYGTYYVGAPFTIAVGIKGGF